MKSVAKQLATVKRIKSSMTASWPTFQAYMGDGWEPITQADFFYALYTDQFEKDEASSWEQEEVYVRKRYTFPSSQ
jgi:hypothetical protein